MPVHTVGSRSTPGGMSLQLAECPCNVQSCCLRRIGGKSSANPWHKVTEMHHQQLAVSRDTTTSPTLSSAELAQWDQRMVRIAGEMASTDALTCHQMSSPSPGVSGDIFPGGNTWCGYTLRQPQMGPTLMKSEAGHSFSSYLVLLQSNAAFRIIWIGEVCPCLIVLLMMMQHKPGLHERSASTGHIVGQHRG